jgi:glyoxylase-like metal-dependent hydrolase (beta-lactamase superfamily II)
MAIKWTFINLRSLHWLALGAFWLNPGAFYLLKSFRSLRWKTIPKVMEIYTVANGNMKLDGGAMFGVIPKALWDRQYESDENNMVSIAMRSLLVVDGDRRILFDNGIGDKQDEKFFGYYYLNGEDTTSGSLASLGYGLDDVTDMVLTHLHFDHCGGSIKYNEDRSALKSVFPKARYWVSRPQWELALNPNRLESASFLKENILPIKENGQLELFEGELDLTPNVQFRLFNGHTAGQIIALVRYGNQTIVNAADLMPLLGNISMSWVCGYDTQPLVSLQEKEDFLRESLENNYVYYFYHDLENQCCTLKETEKGIRPDRSFPLEQVR